MPQYRVLAVGYYDAVMYDPEGKRRVLSTNKPIKPVPSWLKCIKPETAAQKKKRLEEEVKQAEEDAEKMKQDNQDIIDASFMGEGESTDGNVETL